MSDNEFEGIPDDDDFDDSELSEFGEYMAPQNPRESQSIDNPGPDELDYVAVHTGAYAPERVTGAALEDEDGQAQIDAFFREENGTPLQRYYENVADANATLQADEAREVLADF